ncbi:hypothetical protein RRG08_066949 [Elysia crispata]|uniref:SCP domain-containing protein n=1 Tax=Elysia crispata TaxID=231223 RepID=A0AAE1AP03_9GAST|nr:hypothetical protein RRG08_066949 [Elysia crispata]
MMLPSPVTMLLLLLSVLLLQCAEAKVVDIRAEAYHIVSKHNQARRSGEITASNMHEMRWDEELARRASDWAERCEYRRPGRDRSGRMLNANLYFMSNHVYGNRSIHRMVDRAVETWRRSRDRYDYSNHCGRACSYVQMIMARTDRIGCALSLCEDVPAGNLVVDYGSLFVCYYYPGENLLDSYPYSRGQACSRCSAGMDCRDKLCRTPGVEIVPRDLLPANFRIRPQAITEYRDKLTRDETISLRDSHNKMREGNRVETNLAWDSYLQRWAEWIVHCKVDYPGPKHTYTNFERLEQGTNVYNVVSKWSKEEYNTNLVMEHGCRTPQDNAKCNHFTNILDSSLTSMACAARDCGEGTRQLVCLYDNSSVRPARRTSTRRTDPYAQRRYDPQTQRRRYDPRTNPRRYDPRRDQRTEAARRYDPRYDTRYNRDRRTDYDEEQRRLYEEQRRRRYEEQRRRAEEERRREEEERRRREDQERRRREYEERRRAGRLI